MNSIPTMQQARRRLQRWRGIAWAAFGLELVILSGWAWLLWRHAGWRLEFFKTAGPFLLLWQGVPWLLICWELHTRVEVRPEGDRWRIGRYSEAEVRALAKRATDRLPSRLKNPRIRIASRRGTGGWTWLSRLWPGQEWRKTIWITEGALYYLLPDELEAMLLHEVGHHASDNRCDVPGRWFLADLTLVCLCFWLGLQIGMPLMVVGLSYVLLRSLLLGLCAGSRLAISRLIEHRCDAFAARHAGVTAMSNVLLKIGEEEELTEAVLARAATQLLHKAPLVGMTDLYLAFEEVRPSGRIFHEHLLSHAAELVQSVIKGLDLKGDRTPPAKVVNEALKAFLEQRQEQRTPRLRWRRYDEGAKGRLDEAELATLGADLRSRPECRLFQAESERQATSHPTLRHRLLFLQTIPGYGGASFSASR